MLIFLNPTKIKLGANYISSNTEVSTNNKTTPGIHRKRTRTRRISKKTQQQIDWRRNKLSDYLVMGKSLIEASRIMNIPYDTLYKDQRFLAEQASENMRNHISDLPFNIKQATNGLNKLISMLYDIAAAPPLSPMSSDIGNIKKTSDHVRVMAMSLIKDCMKEKIEILTSQAAVMHALDFVEKTKQQVKEQFNKDMQQVIEQDRIENPAVDEALENNVEIQSSYASSSGAKELSFFTSEYTKKMDEEIKDQTEAKELGQG